MARHRRFPDRYFRSQLISAPSCVHRHTGFSGAVLGLIGIFLPGLLILMGTLPFWDALRKRASARAVMRGVNAAVVGLLGAALYNPVWTSSVKLPGDFAIALVGFVILTVWRAPPIIVVLIGALGGIGLTYVRSG